ncbi:MAG: hypothetical protein HYY62_09060 [Deltaproteobacteria bacterium]|nr:hypothetical protein [Deltaproteobacteria bacterium]
MLKEVLKELDVWVRNENKERSSQGTLLLRKTIIRILGQTALLEAKLQLEMVGTVDVDAYIEGEHVVRKQFDELLQKRKHHLDPDSEKVWMPPETEYQIFYQGECIDGFLAHPDDVLISKALKAPERNRSLLISYLAQGASKKFLKLAKKYHLDLKRFI